MLRFAVRAGVRGYVLKSQAVSDLIGALNEVMRGAIYLSPRIAEVVKRETQGRGVDLVIEHVGQAVWKDALKCLAQGGRLVTCGATTGPRIENA